MRRSIRWRLQVWYALVLLAVVAGFAGVLYYRVRAARFQEIDAGLEAAVHYLEANLRRFPPHELDGFPPNRPPPPPRPRDRPENDRPGRPPPGPPRPQDRERLLAELTPPAPANRGGEDDRFAGPYFAVWRSDGSVLKANDLPADVSAPDFSEAQSWLKQRGEYREAALLGPHQTHILVGRSVLKEQAELQAFAWQLSGAGAIFLAVGLAGGWLISARILQPVATISATAAAISATNLSERIDPKDVDRELAELAGILNAMFDRLEEAFERQARFTADASHELRTPLAIIRSHAELALSRPRAVEEYRDTIKTCLRASGRMTALVEALLTLARADAGKLDLRRRPVDLQRVVEESIALCRPLAEGQGVTLSAHLTPIEVTGDADRLGQVVTNLLSNAVQYNRPGGEVRVQLEALAGEAVLSVTDTGRGIAAEDRPHLFERFYRVDKARSSASGGHGLGLAICKSMIEAHGGTIGFETEVDQGSTFWVRLPTACAAEASDVREPGCQTNPGRRPR